MRNIKKIKAMGLLAMITGSLALGGCTDTKEEDKKTETSSEQKSNVDVQESMTAENEKKEVEVPEKEKEETKETVQEETEVLVSEVETPSSPAEDAGEDENVKIGDPEASQENIDLKGIKGTDGKDILKALKKYGFMVEDGLEAPDGSMLWTQETEKYSCDMQADPEGNIYHAVFTAFEEDEEFLTDCAKAFNSEAETWIKENIDSQEEAEIGELFISISEGPMGQSMQICSLAYQESVIGPK